MMSKFISKRVLNQLVRPATYRCFASLNVSHLENTIKEAEGGHADWNAFF